MSTLSAAAMLGHPVDALLVAKTLVVRIDSKGKFSKPECPECSAEARRHSRLRRKQN